MSLGSPGEKQKLRDMITNFYAIAGDIPPSQLQINDRVATVFGTMMHETGKCTKAMSFIPTPPGRKITVVWIVTYVAGIIYDEFLKELNKACVKKVLLNWSRELERAGSGL